MTGGGGRAPQHAGEDLGELGHEDGEQEGGADVDEEVQHGGHGLRHVAVNLHSSAAAKSNICGWGGGGGGARPQHFSQVATAALGAALEAP